MYIKGVIYSVAPYKCEMRIRSNGALTLLVCYYQSTNKYGKNGSYYRYFAMHIIGEGSPSNTFGLPKSLYTKL